MIVMHRPVRVATSWRASIGALVSLAGLLLSANDVPEGLALSLAGGIFIAAGTLHDVHRGSD